MNKYLILAKKNYKEISISLMYFFRQAFKFFGVTITGNLDPFFAGGILEIFDSIKKKKVKTNIIIIFCAITLYAIIQTIFIKDLIIKKLIINVLKIIICILSMKYVKDNINKIDLIMIARIVSGLMLFSTILALIFNHNDFLWRFNDYINKYTATRLKLFYIEPSELGFHIAITFIILISNLSEQISKKDKLINIGCIGINIITLYFAMPMGAILCLTLSIFFMLLWNLIKKFNKKKLIIYIVSFIMLIILLFIMYKLENPIMMRIKDTIAGNDSSNSYRIDLSINLLKKSINENYYLGCGFGNLNSHNFRIKHAEFGIAEVIANSYIYYIIETGIFGIITLITLISYLIKKTFSNYSIIKVGLLIFLIAYQVFGGHFTSGLTWAIYGIIASNYGEYEKLEEG